MKRWDLTERGALEPMEETANGDWVLFEDVQTYAASEYARGYANGSGDEGHYQREIARLKGNLSLAEEGLANYAQENERLRALLRSCQVNAVIPGELESDIEHAIGPVPQSAEHELNTPKIVDTP